MTRRGVARRSSARLWLLALCVLPVAWSACGGSGSEAENPDDAFDRTLEGVEDTRCEFRDRKDRVAVLTVGRGAKAPNVRRVYAVGNERDGRRILRCREVDTNLDGAKDVVRTYDETGSPELEQSDTDYDGRIDTRIVFRGGEVVRSEYDVDQDGKPDEFQTYSGGRLARAQRDATLDGEVDTWEVYEQGRLRRIGKDIDGDKRVDLWYRDESKKAEANGVAALPPPAASPTASTASATASASATTPAPASTGTASGAASSPSSKPKTSGSAAPKAPAAPAKASP